MAGTVGMMLVVLSPLLVNAANSDPSRHPTAAVLAIALGILCLTLLIINVVGLLRYPEWRRATDAAGTKWNRAALPLAAMTVVIATALWLATQSDWPFLIFLAAGGVLLRFARPRERVDTVAQ